MGAAKIPEQINERFVSSGPVADWPKSRRVHVSPPVKLSYCTVCFESFVSEPTLAQHIAAKHGRQHVYLKVDERIIRDICCLSAVPKTMAVVLLDCPQIPLTITVDGQVSKLNVNKTTNLNRYLKAAKPGSQIEILAGTPGLPQTYRLFIGVQPQFEADKLDDQFRRFLAEGLNSGRQELMRLREGLEILNLSEFEQRYRDGILEFIHGSQLKKERNLPHSKTHLEKAFELLLPFDTELAREARYALALTMNCFSGQWSTPAGSRFHRAEAFFCAKGPPLPKRNSTTTSFPGIPIDELSIMILAAVDAYAEKDDDTVLRIVDEIRNSNLILDRNDEEKVTLLAARAGLRRGDLEIAKREYGLLADGIHFFEEAFRILKKM
ncbi:MAG: hypothetical protein JSS02_23880 [Planctomycetes bacterium]|nr:hypothetical protein [Planctomycetota bacterium]